MASASTILITFILILVVATVVFYLLIGTFTGQADFISSRLTVAGHTLASLGASAVITSRNIAGQALDFAILMESDINQVLVAATNAFAQTIETLGIALVDVINFIVLVSNANNTALIAEINGYFEFLIVPITDTLENVVVTIVEIGAALINGFDLRPCSCNGTC